MGEEIKMVKKRFNLVDANADLKKRQDILAKTKKTTGDLNQALTDNFACMCITVPEDKKELVDKELKVLRERLNVVDPFNDKVTLVEEFVSDLTAFDVSLKTIDAWMATATAELDDIKNCSASMAPEDRVARTMDLQEDIAAKIEIIKAETAKEQALLPQGDAVPADAQDFKNELKRITDYVTDLQKKVATECDKYSEDVKFWAEFKTGIKEFGPWIAASEIAASEGLSKPTNLEEAKALQAKVHAFDKGCVDHLKLLESANAAAQKMTSHETADVEVALSEKGIPRSRLSLMNGLLRWISWPRSGPSWTTPSLNSTPGWPRTRLPRVRTSSLSKRWSPLWENSRTSSRRRKNW